MLTTKYEQNMMASYVTHWCKRLSIAVPSGPLVVLFDKPGLESLMALDLVKVSGVYYHLIDWYSPIRE